MKKYSKIISIIIIMATMLTIFTGCGEIQSAETTVNNTFKALKAADFEKASDYIDLGKITGSEESNTLLPDENVYMESLFGKIKHEIVSSEKVNANTVVVKTKITTVDMEPVLREYFAMVLKYTFENAFANPQPTEEETEKKMQEMFVECLSKEDLATITNEVDIKVVKVDNTWKIETSDTLSNALLGGLTKAVENISGSSN